VFALNNLKVQWWPNSALSSSATVNKTANSIVRCSHKCGDFDSVPSAVWSDLLNEDDVAYVAAVKAGQSSAIVESWVRISNLWSTAAAAAAGLWLPTRPPLTGHCNCRSCMVTRYDVNGAACLTCSSLCGAQVCWIDRPVWGCRRWNGQQCPILICASDAASSLNCNFPHV